MTESCLAVKMNELAVDITTQTTLLVGKAACFRTVHVEQYQQYHGGQGQYTGGPGRLPDCWPVVPSQTL